MSATSIVTPEFARGGELAKSPHQILQSALAALGEGRVPEVVAQFDDHFTFKDHALTLEFTDKIRLIEFLNKSRELFPNATLEVLSIFGDGDQSIGQWKLSATQTVPCGAISYRFPVSLFGATIVCVEDGKIVQWTDYYDQSSSRRVGLAGLFTEWIEY